MPGTKDAASVDTEPTNEGTVSKKVSEVESPSKKESNETSGDKDNVVSEAGTLLAQGKRHLFVKDYPSAVAALGDACSKFSEIYGELAYECADAYFNYGCALLELAREESGVLEVDNKDEESEESEEAADEETEEGGEDKKDDKEKSDDDNKTDTKDTENKTDEGEKEATSTVENTNETKSSEAGDEAEAEDDEDVNNLQLAWEMFELAKRSFDQKNDEIKLAETYLKLGEVALESENYDGAISDIQNCLEIQKKILPPISREIAETQFQLGVACSLSNQFDEAIKHFSSAGNLLENRIENLSKMSEPEPEKAKNPFYSIKNEIEEIKALLPEIKDKIVDMEEFKKETMKVVQATIGSPKKEPSESAGTSTNGTSSSSSTSSKAPANDISHLIRKKRKPEDSNESDSKKPNLGKN